GRGGGPAVGGGAAHRRLRRARPADRHADARHRSRLLARVPARRPVEECRPVSHDFVTVSTLQVDRALFDFVNEEALPGSGVTPPRFWDGLAAIVDDLGPRHRDALAVRERLQEAIDQWHVDRRGQPHDPTAYHAFLRDIGYVVPAGEPFT